MAGLSLADVFKGAGVTQTKVAESLGIARATVNGWVAGRAPLPVGRVDELASVLGVDRSLLEAYTSTDYRAGPKVVAVEPVTLLDWMLQEDSVSGHVADKYKDRVAALAEVAGVKSSTVLGYLRSGRMPVDFVLAVVARYWPGTNPAVFAPEVVIPLDERKALLAAIGRIPQDVYGAATFDEVIGYLQEKKAEYRAQPYESIGTYKALRNGQRVVERYESMALKFRAMRGPNG